MTSASRIRSHRICSTLNSREACGNVNFRPGIPQMLSLGWGILVDLPELSGRDIRVTLGALVALARGPFGSLDPGWEPLLFEFMLERVR